ncbi:hypothetical protein IWW36_004947, partial [Coemansia brasiliensis]
MFRFYEREDAEDAYDHRRDIMIRRKPVTIEFARGQRKTSREMRLSERYVADTIALKEEQNEWLSVLDYDAQRVKIDNQAPA